jgi:hypothetical protein
VHREHDDERQARYEALVPPAPDFDRRAERIGRDDHGAEMRGRVRHRREVGAVGRKQPDCGAAENTDQRHLVAVEQTRAHPRHTGGDKQKRVRDLNGPEVGQLAALADQPDSTARDEMRPTPPRERRYPPLLIPGIKQQKSEDRGNGDRHHKHRLDVEIHAVRLSRREGGRSRRR